MPYKVAVRNNETGEIRVLDQPGEWFGEDGCDDRYWWMEGNFSCDCNRGNEWYTEEELAAKGFIDADGNVSTPCSDGKFSALYADLPDGRRIPLEEGGESSLTSRFLWISDQPPTGH